MSIFMLIVSSANTETSQLFVITPGMQIHGKSVAEDGSGAAFAPIHVPNQLTFRLIPEGNPFIYDRTRIVLQPGLSEGVDNVDIAKSLNPAGDYFQLYSGSQDRALAKNALPEAVAKTTLCVSPPKYALSCRLTVEGVETITTDDLLLKDNKLNVWAKLLETPEYVFTSEPNDTPERFTLYFKAPTGVEDIDTEAIYAYYANGSLHVNRLTDADNESRLSIYNPSGLVLQTTTIDNYPQYSTAINLPQGVYIAKLEGNRNVIVKFIKR
ncbi:hypothetical protein AGMMS50262_09220 [Bacteroidia bacterium]|nr:hypothetical protein AGMMS50262_09220 [Bacteroidia bacterium]